MQLAIIGTVGIPGQYGGFETLTEYLVQEVSKKVNITVYCSSNKYKTKLTEHNGAKLKYIALNANGIQSIPYDIISLFRAARSNNAILILGVSGCIVLPIFRLMYPNKRIIINIDGLEHHRAKWGIFIRRYLKLSERFAIRFSNYIIADNMAIKKYIFEEYKANSIFIPYGGNHVKSLKITNEVRKLYNIPSKYAFSVCRIEPENNIDIILKAFSQSNHFMVIIGNWDSSKYGKRLKQSYKKYANILMINAIYDTEILNQIRSNCFVYIHGHSAGGTNPSLVEAMGLSLPIIAFDVVYNRETTFNEGLYFNSSEQLINLVEKTTDFQLQNIGQKMLEISKHNYTWNEIANKYFELINED